MLLRLLVETSDGHVLIRASGELDVSNSASLTQAGEDAMADGYGTVLLDFSGITFMDSTGIGVLVIALRRTRASDGSFAIAGAQGRTHRTLSLTGLDRVFSLYDTVEEAQAALARLVGA